MATNPPTLIRRRWCSSIFLFTLLVATLVSNLTAQSDHDRKNVKSQDFSSDSVAPFVTVDKGKGVTAEHLTGFVCGGYHSLISLLGNEQPMPEGSDPELMRLQNSLVKEVVNAKRLYAQMNCAEIEKAIASHRKVGG